MLILQINFEFIYKFSAIFDLSIFSRSEVCWFYEICFQLRAQYLVALNTLELAARGSASAILNTDITSSLSGQFNCDIRAFIFKKLEENLIFVTHPLFCLHFPP